VSNKWLKSLRLIPVTKDFKREKERRNKKKEFGTIYIK
jgi:hypothetical protein